MAKKSRDKGKAGEREFLRALSERLGFRVKRNHAQADESGSDAANLPVSLEVKRAATQIRSAWMEQAFEQAKSDGKPAALAYRLDRGQWRIMLVMDIDQFAEHLREEHDVE